jgi:hypothetical protein
MPNTSIAPSDAPYQYDQIEVCKELYAVVMGISLAAT